MIPLFSFRGGAGALAGSSLLCLLCSGPLRASSVASNPAEAMAFVQTIGDVRIDPTSDSEGPKVLEGVELGTGSAFVIAPSGLLLTNHHVVSGERGVRTIRGIEVDLAMDVERIEVTVGRGEARATYQASVVVSDPELDLAVLEVAAFDLPYLPLGDSEAVEAGDGVTVLGFPFGRAVEVGRSASPDVVPDPTVTTGSLSAARADDGGVTAYFQTDATVHPGNSGGPILDEEGHVIGVVRMKLVGAGGERVLEGPGFGISVNQVKEFLEINGLSFQIPGKRVPAPVLHELDWKGIRVELPDGMVDESPARLVVDSRESGGDISFLAERFVTRVSLRDVEEALLRGRVVGGFFPAEAADGRKPGLGEPGTVRGSARGQTSDGEAFRVEYAVVEVGSGLEKVAARFLGPAEQVAYNASLLRKAMATLKVEPLLTGEVRTPLAAAFEPISLGDGGGPVPLPAGWSREPATRAACVRVPRAASGLLASPTGDFTIAFRVLRWPADALRPEAVARACGQPEGTPSLAYARRYRRLGADRGAWGAFRERGQEVLLFEVEAPQEKLPFAQDLYVAWLESVAE